MTQDVIEKVVKAVLEFNPNLGELKFVLRSELEMLRPYLEVAEKAREYVNVPATYGSHATLVRIDECYQQLRAAVDKLPKG